MYDCNLYTTPVMRVAYHLRNLAKHENQRLIYSTITDTSLGAP